MRANACIRPVTRQTTAVYARAAEGRREPRNPSSAAGVKKCDTNPGFLFRSYSTPCMCDITRAPRPRAIYAITRGFSLATESMRNGGQQSLWRQRQRTLRIDHDDRSGFPKNGHGPLCGASLHKGADLRK